MRLFSVAFVLSAFLTAASSFAQTSEPLTSGSSSALKMEPGSARFQVSLSQQIRIMKAQEHRAHQQSLIRYYDAAGYDYAHPVMNSGTFSIPIAPYSRYIWRRGVVVAPAGFY